MGNVTEKPRISRHLHPEMQDSSTKWSTKWSNLLLNLGWFQWFQLSFESLRLKLTALSIGRTKMPCCMKPGWDRKRSTSFVLHISSTVRFRNFIHLWAPLLHRIFGDWKIQQSRTHHQNWFHDADLEVLRFAGASGTVWQAWAELKDAAWEWRYMEIF